MAVYDAPRPLREARLLEDVLLAPPVRLHEDAVDLLEIHTAHAVTDGLEHGGDAEVACAAEEALRGADDELERIGREGAVCDGDAVELFVDEGQQVVEGEASRANSALSWLGIGHPTPGSRSLRERCRGAGLAS